MEVRAGMRRAVGQGPDDRSYARRLVQFPGAAPVMPAGSTLDSAASLRGHDLHIPRKIVRVRPLRTVRPVLAHRARCGAAHALLGRRVRAVARRFRRHAPAAASRRSTARSSAAGTARRAGAFRVRRSASRRCADRTGRTGTSGHRGAAAVNPTQDFRRSAGPRCCCPSASKKAAAGRPNAPLAAAAGWLPCGAAIEMCVP